MEGAPSDPDPLNLRQFASWKSRSSSCYETLKLIGVGGYGRVYKARERETGELVALKKIKIYKNEGLQVSTRREIKILETLQDEHIIHLKEIIFSPVRKLDDDAQGNAVENAYIGDLCLVLEYMGHDLAGLLGSGVKFTMPQIKCYMKQLLTGVHYCHVNNVIHRDIKGSNILLSNEGHLKLADFGLARTFSWNDGGGLTDEVVTLWFRSPELLLGETDYGPAVDMWSVGCVFGQLLSGSCLPIFCGDNEKEQFEVICGTCGTPDEGIWPGVSSLPNYEVYMPSSRGPSTSCIRSGGSGYWSVADFYL